MEPEVQATPPKKRSRKKLIWMIVISVVLFFLIVLGVYFYLLVQENIKLIEQEGAQSTVERLVESTDDPYLGGENARVVIVEFADFHCPFCRQNYPVIKQLISYYGDSIKIIYRDFPTELEHFYAAEAGACAHEQGKFWVLHDRLFENQDNLTENAIQQYANESGLDMDRFTTCMETAKYQTEVEADWADGFYAGASGTPTYFINGRRFEGLPGFEDFQTIIDQLLSYYNE